MEQEKELNNQPQEEDPQLLDMKKINSSNKIIIENDPSEFEKPYELKSSSQEPNHPSNTPALNPTSSDANQNSSKNLNNIPIIQNSNSNIIPNTNISLTNQNNNINQSLSLNINTDQSYNASVSNEVSSYTPSKSKGLGKKTHREYKCEREGCNKIFYDKCALRKHLLTHGEKLYSCEICHKKFLDNSKLRRHSLVHSGEKPFACPICPKKFSLDFNLRTHMRIHSGEKPYACVFPGCFKRFSQSSNLSAHEKTHELMKKEGGMEEINNKPIFSENPLKYIIENPYSGTETMNNINKINEIYNMMKNGIMSQMNSFNQYSGYQNNGKNHGEIPGMPLQKRTYIKKANKENNNLNINYNNSNNHFYNNNNIYNNNIYNNNFNNINNNIYNNNYSSSKLEKNNYIYNNNNIYGNPNIFINNLNSSQVKQSKKLLFQIQEDNNNDKIESNQVTQQNKQLPKKQIFMTYRDPVNVYKSNIPLNIFNNNTNNNINTHNNINTNNNNATNNNNNYSEQINYNYHNGAEENQENKGIDLNEEEKPEQEYYDNEDIRDDKDFETFRKYI